MLCGVATLLVGLAGAGQIAFAFEGGDVQLQRSVHLVFGIALLLSALLGTSKASKAWDPVLGLWREGWPPL